MIMAARRGDVAPWLVPRVIVVGVAIFVVVHVAVWVSGLSSVRTHRAQPGLVSR